MKTLTFFIALFFVTNLGYSQSQSLPLVCLKTLDGHSIRYSDVIPSDGVSLIYFFNESSKDLTDNFEYLENLSLKYNETAKVNIIAIYDASLGSYGQIKPFLDGNNIDLKTYIDVNGELQKALGVASNSTIILTGAEDNSYNRYFESYGNYSNDILDEHLSALNENEMTFSIIGE